MAEAPRNYRTGEGTKPHPGPSPAVVAERLAQMRKAAKASHAVRVAEQRAWLESIAGLSLEALRRSAPTRLWSVAMLHLGGYDATAIARCIGYTNAAAAVRALRHPAVVRIVATIVLSLVSTVSSALPA